MPPRNKKTVRSGKIRLVSEWRTEPSGRNYNTAKRGMWTKPRDELITLLNKCSRSVKGIQSRRNELWTSWNGRSIPVKGGRSRRNQFRIPRNGRCRSVTGGRSRQNELKTLLNGRGRSINCGRSRWDELKNRTTGDVAWKLVDEAYGTALKTEKRTK